VSFKTKNRSRASQKTERVCKGATKPAEEKSLQRVPDRRELAPPIDEGEAIAIKKFLAQATGVKDPDLAVSIIGQASCIQAAWPFSSNTERIQAATKMMLEIRPENLMEALLATQMISIHHAALSCLMRTGFPVKSVEDADVYARVATRLMRLSMEQMEAMAKLKGKTSRQKVTVEQVHVHEGGQAIVGAVSTSSKAESGEEAPPTSTVRSVPNEPTDSDSGSLTQAKRKRKPTN